MTHPQPSLERHVDVAVVGGSAAGLAGALQLVRQRRSVVVVDDGRPRNAAAGHVHGYLGREGTTPEQLAADGRDEVRRHGGEVLTGEVRQVTRTADGRLRLELDSGAAVVARRVLAATGLVDELPDVAGLREHWGGDVVHCPFCHGYEVRDRRLVQLVTHPLALHPAALWRHLTDRLTLVVSVPVDEVALARLRAAGVDVVEGTATRVTTAADGRLAGVELADGTRLPAEAVVVTAAFRVRAEPFAGLGLTPVPHPSGLGSVVEVDAAGATSVPGLSAAGNLVDPSAQVLQAAADGSRVGARLALALAEEDLAAAARLPAGAADWDARYGDEPMWSGNPNGSLVAEVQDLPPGRALDVGCGEGGDAVWLAEQGWAVTASDVSARALARVGAEASRRGLPVTLLHADANARDAFPAGGFDLVSLAYAAIPRTPDDRAVRSVLDAVAPGGTLLVLSHDLTAVRQHGGRPAFDVDAFVRVEDVAAALAADPGWAVEVHGTRPRPPGAASGHHVDDVVLRAVRRHP